MQDIWNAFEIERPGHFKCFDYMSITVSKHRGNTNQKYTIDTHKISKETWAQN